MVICEDVDHHEYWWHCLYFRASCSVLGSELGTASDQVQCCKHTCTCTHLNSVWWYCTQRAKWRSTSRSSLGTSSVLQWQVKCVELIEVRICRYETGTLLIEQRFVCVCAVKWSSQIGRREKQISIKLKRQLWEFTVAGLRAYKNLVLNGTWSKVHVYIYIYWYIVLRIYYIKFPHVI